MPSTTLMTWGKGVSRLQCCHLLFGIFQSERYEKEQCPLKAWACLLLLELPSCTSIDTLAWCILKSQLDFQRVKHDFRRDSWSLREQGHVFQHRTWPKVAPQNDIGDDFYPASYTPLSLNCTHITFQRAVVIQLRRIPCICCHRRTFHRLLAMPYNVGSPQKTQNGTSSQTQEGFRLTDLQGVPVSGSMAPWLLETQSADITTACWSRWGRSLQALFPFPRC